MLTTLPLAITACARTDGEMTLQDRFPAQPQLSVAALPVTLIDQTGTVSAFRVAEGESGDMLARPVQGEPRSARIGWTGGACESRVRLVVNRLGGGRLEVAIHTDLSLIAPGCEDVGIPRAVVITFRDPIDPGSISVVKAG